MTRKLVDVIVAVAGIIEYRRVALFSPFPRLTDVKSTKAVATLFQGCTPPRLETPPVRA